MRRRKKDGGKKEKREGERQRAKRAEQVIKKEFITDSWR